MTLSISRPGRWRRIYTALLGAFLVFAASSCNPLIHVDQPGAGAAQVLQPGSSLGQTFVARYSGLKGIEFYLEKTKNGEGQVILHLRRDTIATKDIAEARLSLQKIKAPGFYSFQFTPQPNSEQSYYYAFLEIQGSGELNYYKSDGNTYIDGALYQSGRPLDAQSTFSLIYDPILALLGLMKQAGNWLLIVAAAAFLFVLPGWALFSGLWPAWRWLHWTEKLTLAAGAGLAIYPLLLLFTDRVGLALGKIYAWGPPIAAILFFILKGIIRSRTTTNQQQSAVGVQDFPHGDKPSIYHPAGTLPATLFILVSALILLTRFWAIRNLEAPMWGDSYQHTILAQLLLDHKGLFTSWLPYTPYKSLTVQFGFPALAAVYAWLTGVSSISAVLITGQLVNAIAILAIYPLALRLSKGNAWAGIGSLIIAGLLSPMPYTYVNWGRYAQLAGQAVLPTALCLVWGTLEAARQSASSKGIFRVLFSASLIGPILLTGLAVAGMLLHYLRMPFYFATFVLALLIGWGLPSLKFHPKPWIAVAVVLFAIIIVAGLLFLPWLLQMQGGKLAASVETGVTQGSSGAIILRDYIEWRNLFAYAPQAIILLSATGLLWSLVRRSWMTAAMVLWFAFLASIRALALVHLPGANLMQSFAVLIALYLPAGLICGWLIGELHDLIIKVNTTAGAVVASVLLLAASLAGAWQQKEITNPAFFAMVTRPDSRAMLWIRKNTPQQAVFLVEGFRNGASAVGADAGWWIPLLTRRANTMPPQYAILNEEPIQPDYTARVVALIDNLGQNSPASPLVQKALCDWDITHIYIGQGQGKVSFGNIQLYTAEQLASDNHYQSIYHQDRVSIFSFDRSGCSQASQP